MRGLRSLFAERFLWSPEPRNMPNPKGEHSTVAKYLHLMCANRPAIISMHLVAINAAVFRLVQRYRTKQYYWDDLCAALALILDLVLLMTACIWPMNPGKQHLGNGTPRCSLTIRMDTGVRNTSIEHETSLRMAHIVPAALVLPCVTWYGHDSLQIALSLLICRCSLRYSMHEQDVSHWNRVLDIQDRRERCAKKALHYRSHLRVPSFMDGDHGGEGYHLFHKADTGPRGPILLGP
jgi:hypothetical protein